MPEHEAKPKVSNQTESWPEFENRPNVESVMIPDGRGIEHEAAIVHGIGSHPEQERDGKLPLTLMIGGIPRNAENDPNQRLFSPAFESYASQLADQGQESVVMNPAGMGQSAGDTWQESLATRIDSWESAVDYALTHTNADPQRIRIIGNSMGAHIGLRLAERLQARGLQVDRMALLSPFFYSSEAEQQQFGPKFTQAIRDQVQARDFETSPAFQTLQSYPGKLLVSYARNDEPPVPQGMQDLGNQELAKAIDQNRGVGYGLDHVAHNYKPIDQSAGARLDSVKTIAEASDQIVDFLAKVD